MSATVPRRRLAALPPGAGLSQDFGKLLRPLLFDVQCQRIREKYLEKLRCFLWWILAIQAIFFGHGQIEAEPVDLIQ